MKVKDLIKELQKTSPENTVYLDDGSLSYDFSGVSFDDNADVNLFIAAGDPEA